MYEGREIHTRFGGRMKKTDYLKDLGVHGMIILKFSLRKWI
jgi:hypothetical protein